MQAYDVARLSWPPNFSGDWERCVRHLPQRKKEAIWFFERTVSQDREHYVDINLRFTWMRPSPDVLPCIVSTSHIWQLQSRRELLGEEALAVQGFQHCVQAKAKLGCRVFSQTERMDLSGSAFCGAVLLSVLTAVLAVYPSSEYLPKLQAHKSGHEDAESSSPAPSDGSDNGDLSDLE